MVRNVVHSRFRVRGNVPVIVEFAYFLTAALTGARRHGSAP